MNRPRRTAALLAVAALAVTASAPFASASAASPTTAAHSPAIGKTAHLRGSGQVAFPPSPDDELRFSVDAHARYGSGVGPMPVESWGTARMSHRFTGGNPGFIWYVVAVDCLVTGGNVATFTGVIVEAAPAGQAYLGERVGFSVADTGRRDRVGFSGVVNDDLTKCMAPAPFFTVSAGDYTVIDADHW